VSASPPVVAPALRHLRRSELTLNWRLIAALAFNAAVWIAVGRWILEHF
jgi:hypothetical protein